MQCLYIQLHVQSLHSERGRVGYPEQSRESRSGLSVCLESLFRMYSSELLFMASISFLIRLPPLYLSTTTWYGINFYPSALRCSAAALPLLYPCSYPSSRYMLRRCSRTLQLFTLPHLVSLEI
jgi:hypothetical protein